MKTVLSVIFLFLFLFAASLFLVFFKFPIFDKAPIKVGLVYSTTGFRAYKENTVKEATLLAIHEINQQGGLLGRKIEPISRDAKSHWEGTKEGIIDLIKNEKVEVIFGCWTQGNRYTINEIFDKYNHLLIFPFHYEAIFDSPNIIYVGIAPNQQVSTTISYCFDHFGSRFFLIGSDYATPYVINAFIKDQVNAKGGEVVGEMYEPIGRSDYKEIITKIQESKPNVILSSLLGEDSRSFFKGLRQAGILSHDIPTFSFNLSEVTLHAQVNIEDVIGEYATWTYFQSLDNPINHEFIKNFKEFSGLEVVDDTAECGYLGVLLWAKAVEEAQTTEKKALNYAFDNMRLNAPEGLVTLDLEGRHTWKTPRIGKVRPDGQFEIVWQSPNPIRPVRYNIFRSKAEWNALLDNLYKKFKRETPYPAELTPETHDRSN
jgi:urea transport system substrate-binding protein